MVKILLDAGANPNTKDRNGCTPYCMAITLSRSKKMSDYLLKAGADPGIKSKPYSSL